MKKSLLITLDFPPSIGGTAAYYKNFCDHFPKNDIHVLAPDIAYHEITDQKIQYAVHRKKMISDSWYVWPKWKLALAETEKIIKSENIETLLVGNILPCGTIALFLKKKIQIPYFVFIHGMDLAILRGRKKILAKKILRESSKVFTNSYYTKHLVESFGIPADKIVTAYPCPNPLPEPDELDIIKMRNTHDLHDKKILLTVGRLVERKGHDMVLRAMPEVIKKFENLAYIIAGDGPNKDTLKRLAKNLNVENNVIFIDNANDKDISCLYNLCDAFIMVSRKLDTNDYEGFGIVYLEANSFSKPVIAGKSGGVTEAVENQINGILVDPENLKEISDSILHLLDNPHLAHILGMQGLDRVHHKFQWWKQAKKIENTINI